MVIDRAPGGASLVEVLDRVLDKGIVIDAWVRVSLVGIDLITVQARVVVASIATYMQFGDVVATSSLGFGATANGTRPSTPPTAPPFVLSRPSFTANGHPGLKQGGRVPG